MGAGGLQQALFAEVSSGVRGACWAPADVPGAAWTVVEGLTPEPSLSPSPSPGLLAGVK